MYIFACCQWKICIITKTFSFDVIEKEELQAVLENSEATLEQEEAKVLRAQMDQ